MQHDLTDSPAVVRPGEELDLAALGAYLAGRLPEAAGPLTATQFPRGFSNLTYLLQAGERELVLRRPPFGATIKSAHDMGREYRILSALHPIYPKAPQPLLYCDDPAVIGAPFYLMERVRGLILRTAPPPGLDLTPDLLGLMSRRLVETLAELHGLDYTTADLADLGNPQGYVERQVGGWTRRYRNAQTDEISALDEAITWLERHLPPETGAALIHNDYKFDNLVFDPAAPSHVLAVLDWEMATIGDPLMDLGTTLGYWAEPGDPAPLQAFGITSLPGCLSRQSLVDTYGALTGRATGGMLFYYLFGLFKVAVICQQIYARYKAGHTRDERFAGLIQLVRSCADMAGRAISLGRISELYR